VKEIQDIIRAFGRRRGQALALATLVRAEGSSYRRPGARLLIASDRFTVGALSGGCLEEEVVARAQEVIATGQPVLLSFDTRLRYGCNGTIQIFVEKVRPEFLDQLGAAQGARTASFAATVFENSDSLGSQLLSAGVALPAGAFGQTIPPPLQLVLVGEGPDSGPFRTLAGVLGWKVLEAEEACALPGEFDQWTAAIVKTHNYGRDCAALEKLLPLGLRYVAMLGPRRRRDQLLHALRDAGVVIRSELFAPAGLDLGAEGPEQIALAVVAEIQTTFADASGESLRERRAAIHLARALAMA
jgi:xanthine/CO dehydrogenase XdhC/CoxF family maturation factor